MKFLIPKHLHKLLFREDADRQEEMRHYGQTIDAHFVQRSDFGILVRNQDKKYLSLWESLTFRQQEVLALACMGHKNFEIARILNIEDGTIKGHWQFIFTKFGMRDRHEIRLALRDWDLRTWWEEPLSVLILHTR
jgi:DNA-binding NarL/FixJ family response regulator